MDLTFSNATIWNCPTATTCGAAANAAPGGPTSTVVSMKAMGSSGTFNNPFTQVTFWYQNPNNGRWVQFGSTTTGVTSDDNVTRTWTFTFTWDPPATGADGFSLTPAAGATIALNVRAIGQNSNGDGVMTQTGVLSLQKVMYNEKAPNNGHRLNILSSRFRNVGVDVYMDWAHHKVWLTTDFGRH